MEVTLERVGLLLLVASIVAMLARRVGLPYSVGLVTAGLALSFLRSALQFQLSRDLVFTLLLPPLIFEAALAIRWQELRKNVGVIVALATVGVAISASVTAMGMRWLAGWEWPAAVLFSVLIAATDPVAVIAIFKDAGSHGRLRFLIEAESLFNDGTAAAAFTIALAFSLGGTVSPSRIITVPPLTITGGLFCGAAVAGGALLLAGRSKDPLVETTLTTLAAYGSFLLAEHFGAGGVLATLTAGLIVGNIGPLGALSEKGKESIDSFWQYAAFVANSLVFLLIGINGRGTNLLSAWRVIALAIPLVLASRAAGVYLTLWPFRLGPSHVSMKHQHVLVWGGLRGALALALSVGLPETMPRKREIIIVTFAVVAFSVFVQGLTVAPLLRRVGEGPKS